jgi:hypothetical protein
MRNVVMTAVALMVSATAYAQGNEVARRQAVEIAARVPFEQAFKGAPYSAETVVESTQTLADGNRINRKTTGRVYRDSDGRTRREEDRDFAAMTPGGPTANRMTSISIVDPVAGFSYSLDPEHKVAWRTPVGATATIVGKLEASQVAERRKMELEKALAEKMATMSDEDKARLKAKMAQEQATAPTVEDRDKVAAAAAAGAGGRGMIARSTVPPVMPAGHDSNVPLEHKTLEGVAVEGRKTTTTIPAGQVGNEQPLTITSEEWRSPDLNVLVMTKHSDPRTGESSYRLQNIVRAEPDRSLFIVPPDYEVKETGIKRMEEARVRK